MSVNLMTNSKIKMNNIRSKRGSFNNENRETDTENLRDIETSTVGMLLCSED